jgi:precorrin-3B synthase
MLAARCAPEPRTGADRCPGALALHEAQDGWLARVRVPGGRLRAGQVDALARAAALGNGLVDLTSRGNLQVRGLAAGAGLELAALLRAAGLLPSDAHDKARNVLASPLAGRHPDALTSTDATVEALDRLLCAEPALADLPGRFLFAVDDGSGLALEPVADVALVARTKDTFSLLLAGREVAAGVASATLAVRAALAFLEERSDTGERSWRLTELAGGPAAVADRLGLRLGEPVARGAARLVPGFIEQRDGRSALTALVPLGRLDASALAALAGLGGELRVSSERTITLVDLDPPALGRARATLGEFGLVLEDGSGWVGLTACAGLGRCAKARLDVRAAAQARAGARGRGARPEHWAACERGCGRRAGQPVAVTARPDGGLTVRQGEQEHVVAGVPEALAVLA